MTAGKVPTLAAQDRKQARAVSAPNPSALPAALADTPAECAAVLARLMRRWAERRRTLTETYARAYLAAVGADGPRTQAAKLAAAAAQYDVDAARADVEGYRVMLTGMRMLAPPDADPAD